MAEEKAWKPLELAKTSAAYLASRGVPDSRLDAELLLCRALGLKRRIDLYAGFDRPVSREELDAYRELVRRRSGREPVSRILGEREFMGIAFEVTPAVLSPRPETELLVEEALRLFRRPPPPPPGAGEEGDSESLARAERDLHAMLDRYGEDGGDGAEPDGDFVSPPADQAAVEVSGQVRSGRRERGSGDGIPADPAPAVRAIDLGTGSGCVAVSLAACLPGAGVTAVDVSGEALEVARRNAVRAGVAGRVEFRLGDWFSACGDGERFDLVLSNPPYLVPGDREIWPEVRNFDPEIALYGGSDGLDAYRAIAAGLEGRLAPGGKVLVEAGAGQAGAVADLLAAAGVKNVRFLRDHAGIDRVVAGDGP